MVRSVGRPAVLALFLVVISVLFALAPVSAKAAQPFDAAAFETAQKTGKAIVLDVTASWCPTCRVQKPILESLAAEMPGLLVFEIDFDKKKDVLRRFRVQYQSTLIVFKGIAEVGRSTGDTNRESIKSLVTKGL